MNAQMPYGITFNFSERAFAKMAIRVVSPFGQYITVFCPTGSDTKNGTVAVLSKVDVKLLSVVGVVIIPVDVVFRLNILIAFGDVAENPSMFLNPLVPVLAGRVVEAAVVEAAVVEAAVVEAAVVEAAVVEAAVVTVPVPVALASTTFTIKFPFFSSNFKVLII
jgi:hypothetical protein